MRMLRKRKTYNIWINIKEPEPVLYINVMLGNGRKLGDKAYMMNTDVSSYHSFKESAGFFIVTYNKYFFRDL